jgi:ZIP family zinc transporter/zinc and cadmium transporter
MSNTFWPALIASSLAALVTTIGIYTIRRFESWAHRNSTYFICFASGVLISVSLLHIIPRSSELAPDAPTYVLLGFLLLLLFNRFFTGYVCDRYTSADYSLGVVSTLGIGFHSFLDGMVYSVTFTVSIFTGALAATGMVLHEFPEGIITYVLLARSGIKDRSALIAAVAAAGLTTPLGMLVSFPFVSTIGERPLGVLLALSGGALLYVGASHLLPQAEKEKRRYSLIPFAVGILIAVLVVLSK